MTLAHEKTSAALGGPKTVLDTILGGQFPTSLLRTGSSRFHSADKDFSGKAETPDIYWSYVQQLLLI
jgi:hypothetical protein